MRPDEHQRGRAVIGPATSWSSVYGTYAVVWLLNMVLLEGIVGGTVGKLACGIRTVKHDGSVCGIGRALLRNMLLIIDAACLAIIGIITSATTKGHRRVGDMAASTLVVAKSQLGHPVNVPGVTSPVYDPYATGGYPGVLPGAHGRLRPGRRALPLGRPLPRSGAARVPGRHPHVGRQAQRLHPVRHRPRHLARARHRVRRVEAHQPVTHPANVLWETPLAGTFPVSYSKHISRLL